MDQPTPFQRSMRMPEPSVPTATQNLADGQDTPCSHPSLVPRGTDTACLDHVEPFQCSTSGADAPLLRV